MKGLLKYKNWLFLRTYFDKFINMPKFASLIKYYDYNTY